MSKDQISVVQLGKKRKKDQAEDVGFPPALKPIITESPALKPKLMLLCEKESKKNCRDESEDESEISYAGDSDEGSEECMTPRSVEDQVSKIIVCPGAPRKPRATALKRPLDFFHVTPDDLNLVFKVFKSDEKGTEHFRILQQNR